MLGGRCSTAQDSCPSSHRGGSGRELMALHDVYMIYYNQKQDICIYEYIRMSNSMSCMYIVYAYWFIFLSPLSLSEVKLSKIIGGKVGLFNEKTTVLGHPCSTRWPRHRSLWAQHRLLREGDICIYISSIYITIIDNI